METLSYDRLMERYLKVLDIARRAAKDADDMARFEYNDDFFNYVEELENVLHGITLTAGNYDKFDKSRRS